MLVVRNADRVSRQLPSQHIERPLADTALALVGALVGVAFGVAYGWITTKTMFSDNSFVMRVPVGQLLAYVGLAAVAGVIAAVLPARRATKSSVVSALS